MKKRLTALALALAMLGGLMLPAQAAESEAGFPDTAGHYARETIETWSGYGVLKGYPDGSFQPNGTITRAELAAVLDRVMGYQDMAENTFADLPAGAWYTENLLRLAEQGIFNGDENKRMNPNAPITRQEVFAAMARALMLEQSEKAPGFADDAAISDWAKGYIAAMREAGYIAGDTNKKIRPGDPITRAEVVVTLDRMAPGFVNEDGTYSKDSKGNVIVNAKKVTLKDMTVDGDLIVADGVGDGDVWLDKVTVKGDVILRGCGENSFHIRAGSVIAGKIIVTKTTRGEIRVVNESGKSLPMLYVNDGLDKVTLEGDIETIIVTCNVGVDIKNGRVNTLSVNRKANVTVEKDCTVSRLDVGGRAADTAINVTGTVKKLVTNAATKVTNSGRIDSAKAAADGLVLDGTKPGTVTMAQGVSRPTNSDGKPIIGSGGSSSGGGSSSSGGGSVTPSTPTAAPNVSPSAAPSASPSAEPGVSPSAAPSGEPSAQPSVSPSTEPSVEPTAAPSVSPSAEPSVEPTAAPSAEPTDEPDPSLIQVDEVKLQLLQPIFGNRPDVADELAEGYTAETKWTNADGTPASYRWKAADSTEEDTFTADQAYRAEITLTPNDGYRFAENARVHVTNGLTQAYLKEFYVSDVRKEGNKRIATIVYDKTAYKEPIDNLWIYSKVTDTNREVDIHVDYTDNRLFPPEPFAFQWYECEEDGTNCTLIEGATTSSLDFPADHFQEEGIHYYLCKITAYGKTFTSRVGSITVRLPLVIPEPVIEELTVEGRTLTYKLSNMVKDERAWYNVSLDAKWGSIPTGNSWHYFSGEGGMSIESDGTRIFADIDENGCYTGTVNIDNVLVDIAYINNEDEGWEKNTCELGVVELQVSCRSQADSSKTVNVSKQLNLGENEADTIKSWYVEGDDGSPNYPKGKLEILIDEETWRTQFTYTDAENPNAKYDSIIFAELDDNGWYTKGELTTKWPESGNQWARRDIYRTDILLEYYSNACIVYIDPSDPNTVYYYRVNPEVSVIRAQI